MSVSLRGAIFIRTDRDVVWAALHDVDVLASCIPGCQSLERASDAAFRLSLRVWLGPVRLAFGGTVEITAQNPERVLHLVGRGDGGRAGEASGTALITLDDQEGGCRLTYVIEADTRGPLAAAGSPILGGVGTMLTQFFASKFADAVGHPAVSSAGHRLPDRREPEPHQ